ncbi:MAG: hypothetical protein KA116_04320 [Proteobacteria bacterium]|nr:hypothetical protein [Pseudomonadota bacterium]
MKRGAYYLTSFIVFLCSFSADSAIYHNKQEQIDALKAVISELRVHYGKIKFKERHFGVTLERLEEKYTKLIQSAQTLEEFYKIDPTVEREQLSSEQFEQLLIGLSADLNDGHANILRGSTELFTLGIKTAYSDGKLMVTGWDDNLIWKAGLTRELKVGDEIVSVNGKSVHELAQRNVLYAQSGTFADRLTMAYELILNRSHRWVPSVKEGEPVIVEFKREKDTFMAHLPWIKRSEFIKEFDRHPEKYKPSEEQKKDTGKYVFGSGSTVRTYFKEGLSKLDLAEGSILNIGQLLNAEIRKEAAKNGAAAKADEKDSLKEDKPEAAEADKKNKISEVERIEAYTVRYKGKNLGVLRIPNYSPGGVETAVNELKWIAKALKILDAQTDALIIDQASNGGGFVFYVKDLVKLFAKDKLLDGMTINLKLNSTILSYYDTDDDVDPMDHPGGKDFIPNFAHLRLNDLLKAELKKKYEAGEEWSGPLPSMGEEVLVGGASGANASSKDSAYSKPVVILNDVRSASGGDFFPSLMQKNNLAWVMGTTSSGLGGPVYRSIASMPGSEMFMRCTMGECAFADGSPLENVGAVADVYRDVTQEDVQKGFKQFTTDVLEAVLADLSLGEKAREASRFQLVEDAIKVKRPEIVSLPAEAKSDPILPTLQDNLSIYVRLKTLKRIELRNGNDVPHWMNEKLIELEEKLKLSEVAKKCYEALIL